MNKIFRKCNDFGLMIRLVDIPLNSVLECVQKLVSGNAPLCIIDIKKNKNWELILKEIAFKADLFIAAENVTSLEEAYTAAACGAQFFILESCDEKLIVELKNSGFYFIPKIDSPNDIKICEQSSLDCVICSDNDLLNSSNLINVLDNPELTTINNIEHLFSIIDLPPNIIDYELWVNSVVKKIVGLNYTEIYICKDANQEIIEFANIFASTNKCKICNSNKNTIILECNNFNRAISYFKWQNIYFNPNDVDIIDDRIVKATLDKELFGFSIILKERCNNEY
ncbi:MAG: hypothetical protein OCD02_09840 [Spirochaetaceae bacterium]